MVLTFPFSCASSYVPNKTDYTPTLKLFKAFTKSLNGIRVSKCREISNFLVNCKWVNAGQCWLHFFSVVLLPRRSILWTHSLQIWRPGKFSRTFSGENSSNVRVLCPLLQARSIDNETFRTKSYDSKLIVFSDCLLALLYTGLAVEFFLFFPQLFT